MTGRLPIHAVRTDFESAFARGPVVLSSPTGSGKSTEVPRWLAEGGRRVLVIEPRRVACRSLAARVAELEGTALGAGVGYAVRDDAQHRPDTRIVFATPGIALRAPEWVGSFDVLVLDELHERSLDLDLLLALFTGPRRGPALVVMSATIDASRVAAHVAGTHVAAEGRTHPLVIHHLGSRSGLPETEALVERVVAAVDRARESTGDVLVFLPGRGEIDACDRALRTTDFDRVPLHGGLSLAEQRRAFVPGARRKLVLSTNVAETSVTLPGVSVVIDSGLVRRTRYDDGRAVLGIAPIAEDSAMQRAGRAGRTGPGTVYRLWSESARLSPVTPPEIHRESLVRLLLNAAAWGADVAALPFLDPPRPYAVQAAREELRALGALESDAALSARGRSLFALPIEPRFARLLVEARERGTLDDAIDLVAVLSVGRPLFHRVEVDGSLFVVGDCDASARVRALRTGDERDPGLAPLVLSEARRTRAQLRAAFGLDAGFDRTEFDRLALARTALAADPRFAYVCRTRGREVAFANGGTEHALGRESVLAHAPPPDALVAFESRALGTTMDARIVITAASPVPVAELAAAGLGEERIERVALVGRRIEATLERVYANRVLGSREAVPEGRLARDAVATLYLRGSLFREAMRASAERLERAALAAALGEAVLGESVPAPPGDLAAWVHARLEECGVESGDDVALLSPNDLSYPELPFHVRSRLDADYPRSVSVGDAAYRVEYDLATRRAVLVLTKGTRKDPPPLSYLPKFPGFGVVVTTPRGTHVLRGRA